jgi:hypothetical protein
MHVPPKNLVARVTNHFAGGFVDERAVSIEVEAIDSLAGGVKQKLHLFGNADSLCLRKSAVRNVFVQCNDEFGLSCGVPNHFAFAVRNDQAAVTPNEALLPFVIITLPLDKFREPLCTGGAVIGVNNFIPLLGAAQFFLAVAEDFMHGTIREVFACVDIEDSNSDLGILKNRAEELLVCLPILLDNGCQNHERGCREEQE